jgi:two-component system response regulator HydG
MRANQIKLEEMINFNEGNLDFQGRRLVIHDMHSFAQVRKDLVDMVGFEDAQKILTRFGFHWGQADASAMSRIYNWDNLKEWILSGPILHTLEGVAKTAVKELKIENDSFYMEIIWNNSGEAMEHLSEFGYSEVPICWILTGYASGFTSFCMKKNIYFIEKKCVGKHDATCIAIGKDIDSWGEKINPYLIYYKIEDIKGKIIKLRNDIKEKNKELKEQKYKIELLQKPVKLFLEEIHSKSFQKILNIANRVSKFDTSILITGETGVGKEVVGKYIHNLSKRNQGPFLPINCGALPETLAESELFGHRAGSFTGAIKDQIGLFEQAKGGTILLDEIGDISLNLQLKILRVLQEKEIIPIGDNKPRKIDVRILAATNKNLENYVKEGKFREDLYYRLKIIEIKIPPLRERKEDIITLTRYFINFFSKKLNLSGLKLHTSCYKFLEKYSWPGNVRELENVIERAAVLSENKLILPEHLPDEITVNSNNYQSQNNNNLTLNEIEINYIKDVLKKVDGNKSKAAKILGIGQATLWRKLKGK